MTIQVSQFIQAGIYTTFRSEKKGSLLKGTYGIFKEKILFSRMTQGCGVYVILSSLSSEDPKTFWKCISPFGQFIEIRKQTIESNGNLLKVHFTRHTSFTAMDLASAIRERPKLLQDLLQSMIGLTHNEFLRTAEQIHVFHVSRISQALRFCKAGEILGRLLSNRIKEFSYPSVPALSLFVLFVTD